MMQLLDNQQVIVNAEKLQGYTAALPCTQDVEGQ